MIRAHFFKSGGQYCGFSVSGHAGYGAYGEDIACASVTSAVQLTVNAVTEVLALPAEVAVEENEIRLELRQDLDRAAPFFEALRLHLELLGQEFEKTIELSE